jgi:glycine/D-amino acid oxidase-like deaminating enzyme
MLSNISPWITQLKRTRPVKHLSSNTNTDVVVIGGGIAGISTAYYLLCKTKKNVILIDADKVGHGATGHNAGQAVSYFETPFSDMVSKYGLEMAGDAVRAAESGFELIEEIFANAEIKTKFYRFTGYAGFMYLEIVIQHLETKYWGLKAGLDIEQIFVAENAPWLDKIPERYKGLYSILPQSSILSCLETDNKGYFAMMSMDKGVMNSAIFSEEVAEFMLSRFKDRFTIYEESPVEKIILGKDHVILHTKHHTIDAEEVVLCTNGYKNFTIENFDSFDINNTFQGKIQTWVAYMLGYREPMENPPTASCYYENESSHPDTPYFYLTRRPYELEKNTKNNLICIGGPEVELQKKKLYSRTEHEFDEHIVEEVNAFMKRTYKPFPKTKVEYDFHWHGLICYTPNSMRIVGKEPCNPRLFYNLGCNGVGILLSVYGGKRVAQMINKEKVKKTIFDPIDVRCHIK